MLGKSLSLCLGAGTAVSGTKVVKSAIGWRVGALRTARRIERYDPEADYPGLWLLHVGSTRRFRRGGRI